MAELTEQEAKYIELALEPKCKNDKGQLTLTIASSWKFISEQENKTENELKKEFGTLDKWLTHKVFGDKTKLNEIEALKEKFEKIKKIWAGQKHRTGFASATKFEKWLEQAKMSEKWGFIKNIDDLRKKQELIAKYERGDFGFRSFKNFYEWYESMPKECCYCGTSENDLKKLFKEINDESERDKKPLYSKKRGFTSALQVEKLNPNKPYNESNCKLACAFCNNAKSDMVNEDNFKEYFVESIKNFFNSMRKKGRAGNEMPFFEKNNEKDDSRQYQTKQYQK